MNQTNNSLKLRLFATFVVVLIFVKSPFLQDQLIKAFRGPNPPKPVEYEHHFR